MKLQIFHHTKYSYSKKVFLEPHYLSFYPQKRPHIHVEDFQISISPEPDGLFPLVNVDNNIQHQCWFDQLVDWFEINVEIKVRSHPFNPFDFLVHHHIQNLYSDQMKKTAYLELNENLSNEVLEMVETIRSGPGDNYLNPVNSLLYLINKEWKHEARYDDFIHSPNECFKNKDGSCRDLAWMMINMLRKMDIPSRFVSGYAYNPEIDSGHELHAWVEFIVPGAGWIGVDPSAGIYVDENYIPVSTSHIPRDTYPVAGFFRGDTYSLLETDVNISKVED